MKETQILLSICLAIARFTTTHALAIPSEVYNDDETLELGVWLYPDVQNDVATSPPRDRPLLPEDYARLVGFLRGLLQEISAKNGGYKNNKSLRPLLDNVNAMFQGSTTSQDGFGDMYSEFNPDQNTIPQRVNSRDRASRLLRQPAGLKNKRASLSTEVSMEALRGLVNKEAGRRSREDRMKGLFRMG